MRVAAAATTNEGRDPVERATTTAMESDGNGGGQRAWMENPSLLVGPMISGRACSRTAN